MGKFKAFGAVFFTLSLVAFSGCNLFKGAVEPSGELIQEGLVNAFYEVNSASYEMTMKLDAKAPEGETPESVVFDLVISGAMDNSNPKAPKFTMKLDGSGNLDKGPTEMVKAEIRSDAANFYMILEKLTDFDGMIPSEATAEFIGKWWKMPIPEGTFDSIAIDKTLTPEQEKFKELVLNSRFFKDVKYDGTQKVMGDSAHKFTATPDSDAFKAFMVELAKIDPNVPAPTEGDFNDFDEIMSAIDSTITVYIGVNDNILRGFAGKLLITPPTGGVFNVDFSLMMGDLNKAVKIDVPSDASEFDPFMLMMMGMGMAGDGYDDFSEFEDMDYYGDFDMEEFDMSEFEDLDYMMEE